MCGAKSANFFAIAGDERGGMKSPNSVTNSFSGALRTWKGSLTTSVLGAVVENVRGRDVSHIEWRILPHEHDLHPKRAGSMHHPT